MKFYNVMKLYILQNELLILVTSPQFRHGNNFLLLYTVALVYSSQKLHMYSGAAVAYRVAGL